MLPMPDDVIDRINQRAMAEKFKLLGQPTFRLGNTDLSDDEHGDMFDDNEAVESDNTTAIRIRNRVEVLSISTQLTTRDR